MKTKRTTTKAMAKAITTTPPAEVDRADVIGRLFAWMHAGESVRSFAVREQIPEATLRLWANADEYATQYARAREVQADAHVDHALQVAEAASRGDMDPQAARLLVDTLKWRAAKLHRNRYGDKQTLEHAGGVSVRVEYSDDDE